MDRRPWYWLIIAGCLLFWTLIGWLLVGCAQIEGPCTIQRGQSVVCEEGGHIVLIAPANTIKALNENEIAEGCSCPRRKE